MKNISPKEAIEVLGDMKIEISLPKAAVTQRKRNAAIEMAIDALRYSELPNSSGSISRQAAIEAIEFGITYARVINKETGEVKELFQEGNDELRKAVERVKALPSAKPEKVKCEKCRYVYYDKEFGNYWCNRMHGAFMVEKDGYCKWGK